MSVPEQLKQLRKVIMACGGPDKYIDVDEEADIHDKGKKIGIDRPRVEAILNQLCRNNQWTLENGIVEDLKNQVVESTKEVGAISEKHFVHCVNYAVSLNMPRQRALEITVRSIVKAKLDIKKKLFGKDCFEPLRRKYSE
jgi:hypothetical protein